MSTRSYQARRIITEQKKAGTLLNAAGHKAVESILILDNGAVIASPMSVRRILTAVEKSNSKSTKSMKASETVRLKVYDACDEDPLPFEEEDTEEMTNDFFDEEE